MNFFDISKNKYLRIFFPALAFAIGVCLWLAMKFDFEPDIAQFTGGSAPFIISIVLSVIAAVFSALCYIPAKKYDIDTDTVPSSHYIFGAALCAIMSVVTIVVRISDVRLTLSAIGSDGMFSALNTTQKLELISTALMPFITLSCVFSISDKTRNTAVHTVSWILAACCLIISLFASYFDFSTALNSPVRHYITVTKAALLFFMFSEARISFGKRDKYPSYAISCFACALCSAISLGVCYGMFVYRLTESPLPSDPTLDIYTSSTYFALSFMALSRMFMLRTKEKAVKNDDTDDTAVNE